MNLNDLAFPLLAVPLLGIGSLLLWLFISASFLLWGARLAGIPRRSYARAIGTLLLGGIASTITTFLLGPSLLAGPGLGILLGFGVSSLVMMALFDTTFTKALAANILAWVLSLLVAAGLALLALALFGVLMAAAT